MKVSVYDTYVKDTQGHLMHFDVIVPSDVSEEKVLAFGNEYLKEKGRFAKALTSRECRFCHMEQAPRDMEAAIQKKGYYIYEMEGCG